MTYISNLSWRLNDYFLTRNYQKHVIDEMLEKVSSMSMDDALKPTSLTKYQGIIPFVFTFSPSLPPIFSYERK